MKSYNDFLNESKSKEKPKDEYIELGIGDREREVKEPKEPKENKDEYIELGIGDRKR